MIGPSAPVRGTGPTKTDTPSFRKWAITLSSGTDVMKHKSAEPGVEAAFGSYLRPFVKIDLLVVELQRFPATAKRNHLHAENAAVKRAGGFDAGHGKYDMIELIDSQPSSASRPNSLLERGPTACRFMHALPDAALPMPCLS